jgi:hypothetical protein
MTLGPDFAGEAARVNVENEERVIAMSMLVRRMPSPSERCDLARPIRRSANVCRVPSAVSGFDLLQRRFIALESVGLLNRPG